MITINKESLTIINFIIDSQAIVTKTTGTLLTFFIILRLIWNIHFQDYIQT